MVTVDENSSLTRINQLYQDWESMDDENDDLWDEADCLAVIVGSVGRGDILYAKSTAFQTWLFGYELLDTLCVFCTNEIHILASKKKIEFLKPLESALKKKPHLPVLVLHVRNKADNDESNFKTILEAAEQSKKIKKIGVFTEDSFTGEFVKNWNSALDNCKLKKVDISAAYANVSSTKDSNEIAIIKKACQVTCTVFSKYVQQEIATIVDQEKRVKHSKLADGIEQAIADSKLLPQGVEADQVEICYPPIIQSGGNYPSIFSTLSSDEKLHFGTIICCFGIRYKSYCSNICRTMFVKPTKEMQDKYTFLVTIYEKVLSSLKDGSVLSEIYSVAYNMIEEEMPDLAKHFTRTIGFATGLEFRERSLQLSPKCSAVAKKGMVFCVILGLSNLTNESAEDERGRTYSLFIGDTVLVNEDSSTELTAASKKEVSSIAILNTTKDVMDSQTRNIELKTKLRRHYDGKGLTIYCPDCPERTYTSGLGYIKHRVKCHKGHIVEPFTTPPHHTQQEDNAELSAYPSTPERDRSHDMILNNSGEKSSYELPSLYLKESSRHTFIMDSTLMISEVSILPITPAPSRLHNLTVNFSTPSICNTTEFCNFTVCKNPPSHTSTPICKEFLNSSSVRTPNTQSAIHTIGSNEETTDNSHSESIELTGTKVVMAINTSIPLANIDVIKPSSNVEVDIDDVFSSEPAWINVPEEYLNISGLQKLLLRQPSRNVAKYQKIRMPTPSKKKI